MRMELAVKQSETLGMTKKAVLAIVLLGLVGWQSWRFTTDAGVFASVEPRPYGVCATMHGPPGSEDINIDPIAKVAFISAANSKELLKSRREGGGTQVASGDIWLLDLSDPASQPQPLGVEVDGAFHPHGIDLLRRADGTRELYVVNHPTLSAHEVLVFDIGEDHSLTVKRRITYPELISPNDIVAIGDGRFFVTNDHGSPQASAMARVEEYLGLALSSVTYFDGVSSGFLIEGIKSANGIAVSGDRRTLYIAEALGRSVKRYRRGDSIFEWELVERLDVDTLVDNLAWSNDGRLLAGAHPKAFPLLGHFADPLQDSPSHVIEIDTHSSPMTFRTLFMSDGSDLSGSSVAAMLDDDILIGAIVESHFLRCTL